MKAFNIFMNMDQQIVSKGKADKMFKCKMVD